MNPFHRRGVCFISVPFLIVLTAGCVFQPALSAAEAEAGIVVEEHGGAATERFWPLPDPNRFGIADNPADFGRGPGQGAQGPAQTRPRPTSTFRTRDGRSVAVFDDALGYNLLFALNSYIQNAGYWRFHNYEGPQRTDTNGARRSGIPWTATYPAATFAQSQVSGQIRLLLADLPRQDGKGSGRETGGGGGYQPYKVACNILRRGDVVYLHQDADGNQTEYTALLYLNELWRKNDYGELLFYDQGDVFASVGPKSNRIVIWDSSIAYLTRPPSMACKQSQSFLMAHYTWNLAKVQQYEWEETQHRLEQQSAEARLFSDMNQPVKRQINVQDHIVHKYVSDQGKKIFVLDDLFDSEDLDRLRMFTVNHGNYYFDDSIDSDSDNVQWIAAFDIDEFVRSRLWTITSQVAKHVSGTDGWFPYDIACNIIRSFDHTRIHEDCERQEDEWTFLLYLTTAWRPDYYGETVFRQNNKENAEYVASVLPKYGRVVIFQGIIPHSARPPSTLFDGARLSFAVKLSANPWLARVKMMKQEFSHEEYMHLSALSVIKHYNDDNLEAAHKEYVIGIAEDILNGEEEERQRYLEDLKTTFQLEDYKEMEEEEEEEEEREDISKETEEEDEDARGDAAVDEEFEFEESSDIEGENEFPEVTRRKEYIYKLIKTLKPDAEALSQHYQQFLLDREAMREGYIRELAKLI